MPQGHKLTFSLNNISHLHATLYHFLQKKKSKFKQTLNLKIFYKTKNYNINMQTSKYLNNTSHFYVNILWFLAKKPKFKQTLNLKKNYNLREKI